MMDILHIILFTVLFTCSFCQITDNQGRQRRRSRGRNGSGRRRNLRDQLPVDIFDVSQIQDLSQNPTSSLPVDPLSRNDNLLDIQQRRERLAAELQALDELLLGQTNTGSLEPNNRRGNRRNRQRSRNNGIDLSGFDTGISNQDQGVVPDHAGHDHTSSGRDRFDSFLNRVLPPVDSTLDRGSGRQQSRGTNSGLDPHADQHSHLDTHAGRRRNRQRNQGTLLDHAGHDHTQNRGTNAGLDTHHDEHNPLDIQPGRRRNRQRNNDALLDHAGHDHTQPGQHGGFEKFLDKVLGPVDPKASGLDKIPKKKLGKNGGGKKHSKLHKKANNKTKNKKSGSSITDHHYHPTRNERRRNRNSRQRGLRGFVQNLLLGELQRRLVGPQFAPSRFNRFPHQRQFQPQPRFIVLG